MRFQRRQRTTFNHQQLKILNEAFKRNHYPETQQRDYLAKETNLDPSRIQVWFQNQRAKDRKRRGSTSGDEFKASSDIAATSPDVGTLLFDRYTAHRNQNHQHRQHHQPGLYHDPVCLINPSSVFAQSPPIVSNQSEERDEKKRFDCQSNEGLAIENQPSCGWSRPVATTYIFDSSLANEAARAIHEGRCSGLLEYHQQYYRHFEGRASKTVDEFNSDSLFSRP